MLEIERFCSESLEGMRNQLFWCDCADDNQLFDLLGTGDCVKAAGGLGISIQHPRVLGSPCLPPTLQGQCGGVLTELCRADGPCLQCQGIAQRQVKKRCLLLWERDTEREKIHRGASNWDFDACVADSAALTSPGCQVLVAGFVLWRKTWLLFDPSALGGGGALCRDAAGLDVCPLSCPDS